MMTAEQLEELHNLETHRRDWRSAIVEMKRLADDGSDAGDMHYWEYELKAFDRTFALTPDLARRVIAAEKLAEALRQIAEVNPTGDWEYHPDFALRAVRAMAAQRVAEWDATQ